MASTFKYFAFASNMLKQRLLVNNPSAVFNTVGKLQGHQLIFCNEYPGWHGGGANIVEKEGGEVWGVVWTMGSADADSLDRQEKDYTPIQVPIITPDGAAVDCRTYQLQGKYDVTKPTRHYKDIIVRGAKQNQLPQYYIQQLERVQCNDFYGHVPIYEQIINKLKA